MSPVPSPAIIRFKSHSQSYCTARKGLSLSQMRRQVPCLAVIRISGLATGVADLTADEALLEMLVEVVLHAPKAALQGTQPGSI